MQDVTVLFISNSSWEGKKTSELAQYSISLDRWVGIWRLRPGCLPLCMVSGADERKTCFDVLLSSKLKVSINPVIW